MRGLTIDGFDIADLGDSYVNATPASCRSGRIARRTPQRCSTSRRRTRTASGAPTASTREFLQFGREQYAELQARAKEIRLTFFATAFDHASAGFLADLLPVGREGADRGPRDI